MMLPKAICLRCEYGQHDRCTGETIQLGFYYRTKSGTTRYKKQRFVACRCAACRKAKTVPCGSGWTNDRCSKPLGHRGLHSNE